MTDRCCPSSPASVLGRRRLLAGAALAGAVALAPRASGGALRASPLTRDFGFKAPSTDSPDRRIMFPALGPGVSWVDTYLFPRGGGRHHEGQDLMGPKMTKLLACVSGTVVELRHGAAGNSLYLKGDDGWYYCYLHINNDTPGTDDGANRFEHAFAPGLAKGSRVVRGQHIAYMGDSGNAEDAGSHLHFEIRQPDANLWNAAAVNPKTSLLNAEPALQPVLVPPETFRPWTTSAELVARQYRDFVGREPAADELAYWCGLLDAGQHTPQAFIATLVASAECDQRAHAVARLYQAFFLRLPDMPGYAYWIERRRNGESIARTADLFSRSAEFTQRYGTLDHRAFVERIYRNVLDRDPEPEGHDYWTAELERGVTRGKVMVHFSDSAENRTRRAPDMHVVIAYAAMLGRIPDETELTYWAGQVATKGTGPLVQAIRTSSEYATVVGSPVGGT